ncbi:MAG: glycoside hydrolase family 11 protein [Fibromonadaceae bacterium]|nr:glycoside hydrolase family 11 protein [Fibromonadaceae bacterium]
MKKVTIALCLAITFAVPTAVLADETKTSSTTWTYNNYDCELWSQDNAGTTSMTTNGDNGTSANAKGGTFTAQWSRTINVLFRCGRKFSTTSGGNISGRDPAKPALNYGNISIDFAASWNSTDNVKMLGVYGWAFFASGSQPSNFTNQIEYYIIQDRGSYNSATSGTNSTKKGSATIDGIAYDFYVCDRLNQPMLTGNGNFKQYFSVPQNTNSHRTSGTISVSKHFEEWAKVGMKMDGNLYEVALKVESYTGQNSNANGSATITKNILTIGGTATTSSNSVGGGTSSSSSKPASSSSSVAKTQATTCKTPLIEYPTSTVPSDPYTACFKHTNNKCYVCKVENEGEFEGNMNTCASGWVWDGTQIASNLTDGYWYYEVPCPGSSTQSSSSAVDGSSSSGEDTEPILKNRIPVTHFSLQTLSDKTLRLEANAKTVVEIFDLRGNKVTSLNISGSQTVKLSLPSGVYFAKVHGIKSVRFVLK